MWTVVLICHDLGHLYARQIEQFWVIIHWFMRDFYFLIADNGSDKRRSINTSQSATNDISLSCVSVLYHYAEQQVWPYAKLRCEHFNPCEEQSLLLYSRSVTAMRIQCAFNAPLSLIDCDRRGMGDFIQCIHFKMEESVCSKYMEIK